MTLGSVLRRGQIPGHQLERLLGHLCLLFLVRWELLPCFDKVFRFYRRASGAPRALWPSVGRKLRWARALLCFAHRDLAADVSPIVMVTDASE